MSRTFNRKKVRASRKRRRSTRSQPAESNGSTAKSTQALRVLAQIAMLKRALRAAEDEGLPHKAICDYLHMLNQMAKLEPSSESVDGDSGLDENPAEPGTARRPANLRERLRQVIADIYGISEWPIADPANAPLSREAGGENG